MALELVFSLIVILLLLLIAVVGLIFPAWLLLRCLSSETSTAQKLLWVAAMILAWPFGSFIFGIRNGVGRVRSFSISALLLTVLLIGAAIVAVPYFIQKSQIVLDGAIKEFEQADFLKLDPQQRQKFQESLKVLKEELSGSWLSEVEKKQHAVALLQLLQHYASDEVIDQEEYKDWEKKFEMRKLLTAQAILLGPTETQTEAETPQLILPDRDVPKGPDRPVPE